MSMLDLFLQLRRHNIRLELIDGALKISAPKGAMTPVFLRELKEKKEEIIRFLNENTPKTGGFTAVEPAEEKEYYSLSSAQKRMYILQQMDTASTGYNMPMVLGMEGDLDRDKLKDTFRTLIVRHESLRTSFQMINNTPVQIVHDTSDFLIEELVQAVPTKPIKDVISSFIRPFDLALAPLIRVGLIESGENEYIFLVDMHHIISDGTSLGLMIKEFMDLYEGNRLPSLDIQYIDYAEWQRQEKVKMLLKQQETFWLNMFSGEIPILDLPYDFSRPSVQDFSGKVLRFELENETKLGLNTLALKEGATLFMVLLSVYNALLAKLSGQEDIVVGTPVAGRRHDDLRKVIGMFVNTLALRNKPAIDKTAIGFLREVKETTLGAFECQDYHYEDLVEKVVDKRDTGRNPLFDTMLSMQNMDIPEMNIPGLTLKPYRGERFISKFDLTLICREVGEELVCTFEYSTALFKEETIVRFAGYFQQLISSVLKSPEKRLSELEIVPQKEKKEILIHFNDTQTNYPKGKTISQLFEEQVERANDRCSVISGKLHTTYGELNRRVNRFAQLLQEKGVGSSDIVAIMADRFSSTIMGILAVLKAGGAYLPIDPEYPQERIDFMLKDSNAQLLLTNGDASSELVEGLTIVHLAGAADCITTESTHPLTHSATQLCYIIYTSGSTGRPKGVMVEHYSAVNLASCQQDVFSIKEQDRILQFSSLCFDASVEQILIALLSGAALVLVDKETLLIPDRFENFISREAVTHIHAVPSFLNTLVPGRYPNLKRIIAGGDVCPVSLAQKWAGDYEFYNEYGPTETTVTSIEILVDGNIGSTSQLPIGRPLNNTQVYILDKCLQPVPLGVVGEMHIGGEGVARGYLNRPELTAEKFIHLAIANSPITRLYKTGDLARWMPGGSLEFLGRIDHQVKIRGYRIELGEIETRLSKHSSINEAVVISLTAKSGENYLCAYYTSEKEILDSELREFLVRYLPQYMVPVYFIQLEEMPLNTSGKTDRKRLPQPEGRASSIYVAPGTEKEKMMVSIWQDIVEQEQVGIDDNFFELGGHSLKATTMVHRVHKELGIKINLRDVFSHPTIRQLLRKSNCGEKQDFEFIVPVEQKEYYGLSYAQRRLWVLSQFETDSTAYNIPAAVTIIGDLDLEALRRAVQTLSNRYDSLRTRFLMVEGTPYQTVIPHIGFDLEVFDLRKLDPDKQTEDARQIYRKNANLVFDLENGPLFLVKLVRLEDKKYILIYNIHHIISDGWSQGIINNEFVTLYNTYERSAGIPLPELKLQYKDYSHWHNRMIEKNRFQKSQNYWLDKFNVKPNGIELPLDRPRKAIQTFNGGRISFTINIEMVRQLKEICLAANATLFMSLLTLLNIFLYRYTGQQEIIIGSPIANRKQPELHRLVGFFVNTLVFQNYVNPANTFEELLQETKKETLECYENQDFPFDLLVESLALDRDMSQSPIFNVMLAHNNTETEDDALMLNGLNIMPYAYSDDFNMSKFDLIFFMNEIRGGVSVTVEYNSDLFERSTVERMAENFLIMTENVLANGDIPVASISILSQESRKLVVELFNNTYDPITPVTLQELFQQQVQKSAEHVAVVYDEQVTYRELNRRANRLAWFLKDKYQVTPNNIIGISMERSIYMITVIWGIIKSGAGYLAVDPTYPPDRVLHVLADSQARLLITDIFRENLYGGYDGEIIEIESYRNEIREKSPRNPPVVNQPRDILYVNYTSGSTGTPNGAMLSHDCLTNLIQWQNDKTNVDGSLRVLQFTSINFCVSFQEIMGTLTSGGKLYLIGDVERQDIEYLMNFLSRNRIQVLFLPFSYLNFLFTESGRWKQEFGHSLQHIITAGEQLKITAGLKTFLDENPNLQLHNHYGSTEMHVVTSYTLDASTAGQTPIPPAGKPISNVNIFIVDDHFNAVPLGVWGELLVEGSQEILGYINNKELTDKKLVNIPELCWNKRLYRSGDIGRWLPDGNIELRGRKDFLVKVRGFRVEPGEIESKILSIKGVRESVVVIKEDNAGHKYLVAYTSAEGIDAVEIKRMLSSMLPQYMVPQLMILDSLPLMHNGKVDRERLPEPELDLGREYHPPRDDVERELVEIWSRLLGLTQDKIGINDNFFDLGGHSLKATTMMGMIHKELGVKLELLDIFKSPTIGDIAAVIHRAQLVAETIDTGTIEGNIEEIVI